MSLFDSKNILRSILEAIGDGISIQDTNYKILYQNKAHINVFGDHAGKYCYTAYKQRDTLCEGCPLAITFRDKKIHTVERAVKTDSGFLHVEVTASPLYDEEGNIIAGIEVVRDITERKSIENMLRQSEEKFSKVFHTIPDSITISRLHDDKLLAMNEGFTRLTGFTEADVMGKSSRVWIHPDDQKRLVDGLRKHGEVREMDADLQTRDGSVKTASISAKIIELELQECMLLINRDITERKKAEEGLLRGKYFTDSLINSLPGIFYLFDEEGRFIKWNKNLEDITGYTAEELSHLHPIDFFEGKDRNLIAEKIQEALDKGDATVEAMIVTKSRKKIPFFFTGMRFYLEDIRCVLGTGIDLTDKKRLEEQLVHAQRMEAIGQLAGGIAHDFNNILTAIIGYGNLLQMKMKEDDPLRIHVEQILSSSEKATNLIQSLLAFSRKQTIEPKPVTLNEIVKGLEKLLARLIGEDIKLRSVLSEENIAVMADPGQLEQVLINLAANARDAMQDGGILVLETGIVELNDAFINKHGYGFPGKYALISVTDSGEGMNEEILEKIFEPFFTTKEFGKGTGLGLSMVYGIIKQHKGYLTAYSEPGKGTKFKIYLPILGEEVVEREKRNFSVLQGGSETILVAEDNEDVRKLTSDILNKFGYNVIEAEDGEDAVSKYGTSTGEIKLLILDVIMPKMNGKQVYATIKKSNPGIKAIFLSGYTADIIQKKVILDEGLHVIHKPVPVNTLIRKVREVLDA